MSVEKFNPNEVDSVESNDLELTISIEAAKKIQELFEDEENKDDLSLRVFVTGGGCSGFQYGFTFEDDVSDEDFLVKMHDISVVVDPMSYQYLQGSVIDFKNELMNSSFFINNPQAKTTCGCGNSFSV